MTLRDISTLNLHCAVTRWHSLQRVSTTYFNHNGYRVFPRDKTAGAWHSSPTVI